MRLSLFFIVYSLFVLNESQSSNTGYKVRLHDAADRYGAICLDGGPADYYFAKGEESKKYVLFFQGVSNFTQMRGIFSKKQNK